MLEIAVIKSKFGEVKTRELHPEYDYDQNVGDKCKVNGSDWTIVEVLKIDIAKHIKK